MNIGQKTVTTMLAVVAVMLGLNLIVNGARVDARPLGPQRCSSILGATNT